MNKQPKRTKNSLQKADLSIVILTYNSEKDLTKCLDSIYASSRSKFISEEWEMLIIDNASTDSTIKILNDSIGKYPGLKIIENKQNLGFGPANNLAAKQCKGEYILFLNPDTEVEKMAIETTLHYIQNRKDVGAVSAKLVLGNGKVDMTCHRGFPTPWNSLCYFSGISKLFPKSKIFSGYSLGHLDFDKEADVDSINGAYFLIPSALGRELNFFDPDFFWKGEDLDLCYRIKEKGYKIMYLPQAKVHHFKGASKGHKRGSKTLDARFEVMRLFYDKHYVNKYPSWTRALVLLGIKLRYYIAYVTGK